MNTKIIIYDDSCPLCSAYTNAFVKTGLIEKDGRKNFSSIDPALLDKIDTQRCVNEIPLIDTRTSEVWYGIDALLEILQQRIPFIKPVANVKPVKWLLQRIYKFISYNRRVIVAAKNNSQSFDCTPAFNSRYRLLFILVFLLFNTMMLFPLQQYVMQYSLFGGTSTLQLQLAHSALVLINVFIIFTLKKNEAIEYAGQVVMLALMVILLTVPLILFNKYAAIQSSLVNSFYLGILSFFAVQEYTRRMKFIGLIRRHPRIVAINALSVLSFIIYLAN